MLKTFSIIIIIIITQQQEGWMSGCDVALHCIAVRMVQTPGGALLTRHSHTMHFYSIVCYITAMLARELKSLWEEFVI